MPDPVECYSSLEYPDRPTALLWEGQRLIINKILETRRNPDGKQFCVLTADGQVFELFYSDLFDEWRIIQK